MSRIEFSLRGNKQYVKREFVCLITTTLLNLLIRVCRYERECDGNDSLVLAKQFCAVCNASEIKGVSNTCPLSPRFVILQDCARKVLPEPSYCDFCMLPSSHQKNAFAFQIIITFIATHNYYFPIFHFL